MEKKNTGKWLTGKLGDGGIHQLLCPVHTPATDLKGHALKIHKKPKTVYYTNSTSVSEIKQLWRRKEHKKATMQRTVNLRLVIKPASELGYNFFKVRSGRLLTQKTYLLLSPTL